jgi:hypothetical protein
MLLGTGCETAARRFYNACRCFTCPWVGAETVTDGNTCLFAGSLCPLKRTAQKRPKFRNGPSQRFKEPFYDTDHNQRSGEPQFILSEPLLYRLKHGKRYRSVTSYCNRTMVSACRERGLRRKEFSNRRNPHRARSHAGRNGSQSASIPAD